MPGGAATNGTQVLVKIDVKMPANSTGNEEGICAWGRSPGLYGFLTAGGDGVAGFDPTAIFSGMALY